MHAYGRWWSEVAPGPEPVADDPVLLCNWYGPRATYHARLLRPWVVGAVTLITKPQTWGLRPSRNVSSTDSKQPYINSYSAITRVYATPLPLSKRLGLGLKNVVCLEREPDWQTAFSLRYLGIRLQMRDAPGLLLNLVTS